MHTLNQNSDHIIFDHIYKEIKNNSIIIGNQLHKAIPISQIFVIILIL
jgi:hypothetical protein